MNMAENDAEGKILRLLEDSSEGMQTEEIAGALDLTRHTIAKYLEVLRAKDRITYRKAGRTKIWKSSSSAVRIRHLTKEDVPAILKIVKGIRTASRTHFPSGRGTAALRTRHRNTDPVPETALAYLRETVERHIERNEPLMNLAAECDGKLVGFVIGETRAWEFGQREKTGWIKVLGVDPEYQGKGAGKKLGETLLSNFKASGISRVRTLVNWFEGDLLSYFRTLGFNVLNTIPLEAMLGPQEEADGSRESR
ncbi:GNAT family N-acetyltransferase [Elusimicrobiota bacterium]